MRDLIAPDCRGDLANDLVISMAQNGLARFPRRYRLELVVGEVDGPLAWLPIAGRQHVVVIWPAVGQQQHVVRGFSDAEVGFLHLGRALRVHRAVVPEVERRAL